MKTVVLLLLVILKSFSLLADDTLTKKIIIEPAQRVRIEYNVLKEDTTIRHGEYLMYFLDRPLVHGYYNKNKKTGVWTKFYPEGTVSLQGLIINGRKQGKWIYNYRNGIPASVIYYLQGKKVGAWQGFHSDSSIACELNYKNDTLMGDQKYYYNKLHNNRLAEHYNYSYRDTTLYISEKDYYENGNLFEEAYFINGKEDSIYRSFHKNGKPWEDMVFDYGKLMYINGFTDNFNGPLPHGNFKNGNGLAVFYHYDGAKFSEINYTNGFANGKAQYYYNHSWPVVIGNYKDGVETGVWQQIKDMKIIERETVFQGQDTILSKYKTGNMKESAEGIYVKRMREGIWIYTNMYGEKNGEEPFKYGYKHGKTINYENGIKVSEGNFKFGEKVGIWKYFNVLGKVTFEEEHIKNVTIDTTLLQQDFIWNKELAKKEFLYAGEELRPAFATSYKLEHDFCEANLKYPAEAKKNKVQGALIVQYVISDIGEPYNIKIVKGLGFGYDEAVVNYIKSMPFYEPALLNGIPVEKTVRRMIRFNLNTTPFLPRLYIIE